MKLRSLLAALALGVLPVTAAQAVSVAITVAPPPIPVYEQPPCPVEGYLWTPGYYEYDYDAANYFWVDGLWVPPPHVGYLWTPGYWGYSDDVYVFHTGYWGPTVGFYGGINYGFGYGGYGYYGGRWDGGMFRYNTAVTRVDVTNIHNTYEDRNFRNRTESRAAFNGRGGVAASPNTQERRAEHAEHFQATNEQNAARDQARAGHNPDGPQNTANRDQARTAGENRDQGRNAGENREGGLQAEARTAGENRNAGGAGQNNRHTSRTSAGRNRGGGGERNRTASVGNPNRGGGGRQRVAHTVGGGGGRVVRAPGGGSRQAARAPQGGGGGNKKKH